MILSPITTDQTMLKVLVDPSSMHGLAGPENDKDFQSVIVTPARDMFRGVQVRLFRDIDCSKSSE